MRSYAPPSFIIMYTYGSIAQLWFPEMHETHISISKYIKLQMFWKNFQMRKAKIRNYTLIIFFSILFGGNSH